MRYSLNLSLLFQVWELAWCMVQESERKDEALSLLFMLSYAKVGKGYPKHALTAAQMTLLAQFYEIGIIYEDDDSFPGLFFPTRAAVNLIFRSEGFGDPSDPTRAAATTAAVVASTTNTTTADNISRQPSSVYTFDRSDIKVIVESNMQVLAYVTNDLHLALLRMFVDVNLRMPNMVVGFLTREKAHSAFASGITVLQIIDFLCSHAHPKVLEGGGPPVPDHVEDMLTLWHNDFVKQSEEDKLMSSIAATQGY